jgi:hypothetical protein
MAYPAPELFRISRSISTYGRFITRHSERLMCPTDPIIIRQENKTHRFLSTTYFLKLYSERFQRKKHTPATPAPNLLIISRSKSTEGPIATQYIWEIGCQTSDIKINLSEPPYFNLPNIIYINKSLEHNTFNPMIPRDFTWIV